MKTHVNITIVIGGNPDTHENILAGIINQLEAYDVKPMVNSITEVDGFYSKLVFDNGIKADVIMNG